MVRKNYLLVIDQKSHRQVGERPISIARKSIQVNGMKGMRNLSDTLTSVDLSYPDNYRFIYHAIYFNFLFTQEFSCEYKKWIIQYIY